MKENKKLSYIGLVIYIFCFLFAPPIIPKINFIFIVCAYSCIKILIKYRKKFHSLLCSEIVTKLIPILVLYLLIYLLSIFLNGVISQEWYFQNYIINIYAFILAFPVTLICSVYILFRSEELNLDIYGIMKAFIWAGVIQASIAVLTLVVPSIKDLLVKYMYYATGDKLLNTPWIAARRFYGFAHSMLDLYGFGTGILAVLPIYYGLKVNKKYMLLTPVLLIVPFLNSRSGLVIFGLGMLVLVMANIKKINMAKFLLYIIGIILIISIVFMLVQTFSPETIEWILKDFKSFLPSSERDEVGTADVLFSSAFWNLPPVQNLIIGTGHNVSGYSDYAVSNIEHSDVGYINELWKTGIIGSFLLYYFVYYLLKKSCKKARTIQEKSLYVFFGLAIITFLVKASIFTYNAGTAIIYTMALMQIFQIREEEINEQENISNNSYTSI